MGTLLETIKLTKNNNKRWEKMMIKKKNKLICRIVALTLSVCMAANLLCSGDTTNVKVRNVSVEPNNMSSRYTDCFEESRIFTGDNEKVVKLKAKSAYKKDGVLFDTVSLKKNVDENINESSESIEADDNTVELSGSVEEYDEKNIEGFTDNSKNSIDTEDEDDIEESEELSEDVFDGEEYQEEYEENDLEVDYDCEFDMDSLTFCFEAELVSEDGTVMDKEVINTDAIVTKNGGLDACIVINDKEYMMSDYENYKPVDECSIFTVIKIVAAYLAVAETAEQIKANSNFKYNKKLEKDGKGVKKGYLVYSQSNSTTENRKAAKYRFGFTTFANVGCEVAAAYNIANQLGSQESLSQTIYYFEGYAIEFSIGWGHLGSNPLEIYRYLKKRGFKYSKYTSYKDFKYAVDHKKSCKMIMSRWNKSYKGLHTFYVKKEDYGKHYGYNWSYGPYKTTRSEVKKSLNSFNNGAGFIVGYLVWK